MDNTIVKVFENRQFGNLRVVADEHGEPWFVANDICKCLDIQNPSMAMKQLDDDERAKFNLGRQGEANFVNEAGFYTLVLRSRKPEAKMFRRWVTHEVLPAIRRDGGYMVAREDEPEDVLMARALLIADRAIKERDKRIAEMRPKEIFADAVSASHTSILVGELAKLLKQNGYATGQNRLFQQLREEGYLMKSGSSRNMPTQHSMEMGLFEVKETTITNPDGTIRVTKTPKVTGKGQVYFVNRYCTREG